MSWEKESKLKIILLKLGVVICLAGLMFGPVYSKTHETNKPPDNVLQQASENHPPEAAHSILKSIQEVAKLLIAALLGLIVTAAHKKIVKDKPFNYSLAQAQVLLSVSGAFMMVIIGNSLARAFGLAGAAAFIRFRTPVKDPKETTILFLLVGIGMACGLSLYVIAASATLFVIGFLWVLNVGTSRQIKRSLTLEIEAKGFEQAQQFVQDVLTRNGVKFEVRKITRDETSLFRYDVQMDPQVPIERINAQIFNGQGDCIKSVSWEVSKGSF